MGKGSGEGLSDDGKGAGPNNPADGEVRENSVGGLRKASRREDGRGDGEESSSLSEVGWTEKRRCISVGGWVGEGDGRNSSGEVSGMGRGDVTR